MDLMEAQLRQTYSALDNHELVELRSRTTLTETAYKVLDELIAERDVSASQRDSLLALQAEEEALQRVPDLATAEKCWKRLCYSFYVAIGLMLLPFVAMAAEHFLPATPSVVKFGGIIAMAAVATLVVNGIVFLVLLGNLASALRKNAILWLAIVVLVPLGSLVAMAAMGDHIGKVRKSANAG